MIITKAKGMLWKLKSTDGENLKVFGGFIQFDTDTSRRYLHLKCSVGSVFGKSTIIVQVTNEAKARERIIKMREGMLKTEKHERIPVNYRRKLVDYLVLKDATSLSLSASWDEEETPFRFTVKLGEHTFLCNTISYKNADSAHAKPDLEMFYKPVNYEKLSTDLIPYWVENLPEKEFPQYADWEKGV